MIPREVEEAIGQLEDAVSNFALHGKDWDQITGKFTVDDPSASRAALVAAIERAIEAAREDTRRVMWPEAFSHD